MLERFGTPQGRPGLQVQRLLSNLKHRAKWPLITATQTGFSVTPGAEAFQLVTCCRRNTRPMMASPPVSVARG